MLSVDTNILLYALNSDAAEHRAARAFLESHAEDEAFVLCELVLVELYVLLRNPAVLKRPLSVERAVNIIGGLRQHPRWRLVDHDPRVMNDVWAAAAKRGVARRRIFDARLAFSLLRHGVTRFATRNVKDFEGLGFASVMDPTSQSVHR